MIACDYHKRYILALGVPYPYESQGLEVKSNILTNLQTQRDKNQEMQYIGEKTRILGDSVAKVRNELIN